MSHLYLSIISHPSLIRHDTLSTRLVHAYAWVGEAREPSRALSNGAHLTEHVVGLSRVEAVVNGIVLAEAVCRVDQTLAVI